MEERPFQGRVEYHRQSLLYDPRAQVERCRFSGRLPIPTASLRRDRREEDGTPLLPIAAARHGFYRASCRVDGNGPRTVHAGADLSQ